MVKPAVCARTPSSLPPRISAYSDASKAVFEVFDDTTPLVEALSIDEAFLDVGGLRRVSGEPIEIADRLRREVLERVGLPITVGVARTKFLAKVASAVAKPDGLLVVPPEGELAFLRPLPVRRLWGVGSATEAKLHERGITTVADVARLAEPALVAMLGRAVGHHLHALAHNRDPRPVHVGRRRAVDRFSERARLATTVARGDRRHPRRCGRSCDATTAQGRPRRAHGHGAAALRDSRRATRSHTLPRATAETAVVLGTARVLLESVGPIVDERGLTLLGLAVANLDDDDTVQLSLPFDHASGGALDAAVDGVRERFGTAALTRAVLARQGPRSIRPAASRLSTPVSTFTGRGRRP